MYLRELTLDEPQEIYELIMDVNGEEAGFMMDQVSEEDFLEFLKKRHDEARGIDLKPGRVPQTIYWFYAEERPVGIIKVRRTLTDHLLKRGGNIGYYIRKDYRRAGYGRKMLGMCLEILRNEGMDKILITCDEDNRGSQGVIRLNGGVLENSVEGTRRYWVEL
ncbi:acetyltransferase [Propionigenium maris DSM 9537]|uniref:Acetyltransferase n=1 Tax=Propionigenium maris DSM 9537 TaxID=1123000 RepID=A0A9W6GMQ0_9FUSO|nr:GNAT family N-acetyltransferase [Propionigenium maris]GLI57909.1 acetyltransferase [Propionigenium maris DSM 9537]